MSALTNMPFGAGQSQPPITTADKTTADWENLLGPSGFEQHLDKKRNIKESRLHIPDRPGKVPEKYLGLQPLLQSRVDGLITDTTFSPFTTVLLPYHYIENPDSKIEWNVYSFDEGLASRVPYESSARTLTQRKESFSGYTVRQGLAITMEHNFMASEAGQENFKNQIMQVVNSIQNTNDLDVHVALLNAPSHAKKIAEQYYLDDTLSKSLRDYVDTFGFCQKNQNAMDILIEDTKQLLSSWGGEEPDFLLCSGKITFQLTMTQERTSYYANGPNGDKLLKQGPLLPKYRDLSIVKSRAFSMEEGSAPRDVLRRRVRTAEFYVGQLNTDNDRVELYDESTDNFVSITKNELDTAAADFNYGDNREPESSSTYLLFRFNIEHYMLGMVIGKGGLDHLGATLWGQTELSVFDDGQHGVWGMTYKYHERALVFNEKNMHRLWDISYDGYCAGKDCTLLKWSSDDLEEAKAKMNDTSKEYDGPSVCVVKIPNVKWLPSPLVICEKEKANSIPPLAAPEMILNDVESYRNKIMGKITDVAIREQITDTISNVYQSLEMHQEGALHKMASEASISSESTVARMAYQGTSRWYTGTETPITNLGCGHHGPDYVGVASVRNGKSLMTNALPTVNHVNAKC